ncbi:hypothetical protein GobsT_40210 [Gemmata obscuriglobus]|uniref:Uncharacterized protein n=1 Tax=Gemmata obscuriglobus TaxID=114 RepID=A0A2Z3H889_9BACT|nr:hypothetical protein [Gemmata obscuriglobus]AWM37914.1 hypothetical protein C1280_13560 [Gemmata obscuriglobus]QEG29231.1 hypothetical protein GobsT_40210 [Gemmata obscuriglobus]VTS08039.1 unnamed protein product [Gemmata obscuriglobus UQM 2246]
MTRMSRELSLVVLGATVLTGAYFVWPETNYETEADKQAERRTGGRSRSGGGTFIFIGHFGGGGPSAVSGRGARPPAMASVSKGGFGTVGSRVGGGFGG